jgi:hypothetical protein
MPAAAGLQQQVARGVAAAVVRGLLMLAGDVEPNPGPKKEQRHDDDEGEQMDAGGGGSVSVLSGPAHGASLDTI